MIKLQTIQLLALIVGKHISNLAKLSNKFNLGILFIALFFIFYVCISAKLPEKENIQEKEIKGILLPIFSLDIYKKETQQGYKFVNNTKLDKILNKPILQTFVNNKYNIGKTLEQVTGKKIILLNEYSPYGIWKNAREFSYKEYKKKSKFWKYSPLSWNLKDFYFSGMRAGDLIATTVYWKTGHDLKKDANKKEIAEYNKIVTELGWYGQVGCTITDDYIIFFSVPCDVYDMNINDSEIPL